MPDVQIAGASFSDVSAIEIPKVGEGSGMAKFYDMSGPFSWMGVEVEELGRFFEEKTKLADTGFATWEPTTSATKIVDSKNLTPFSVDLLNYEYIIEWLYELDYAYLEGATLKAMPNQHFAAMYQVLHRRPYGLANIEVLNSLYNHCTTLLTAPLHVYYNTSGAMTWSASNTYGIYPTIVAAALSSTNSNTPNITPKTPTVTARCNSSYFATSRAPYVDQNGSEIKIVANLYRYKKDSGALKNMYLRAFSLYSNPLEISDE